MTSRARMRPVPEVLASLCGYDAARSPIVGASRDCLMGRYTTCGRTSRLGPKSALRVLSDDASRPLNRRVLRGASGAALYKTKPSERTGHTGDRDTMMIGKR